jgi:TRAP-type mannitol/chloroaromatic compound transport system permease small subunit
VGHLIVRICSKIEEWTSWPGKAAGWLILALVLVVCLSVVAAYFRVSIFVQFDTALPLIGRSLSASTLADMQWHLFAVLVMLGGAFALHGNRHVQVDFLSFRFSSRGLRLVTLAGDLLLLLPFCGFMIWFGWRFALTAYAQGEGSAYGGMTQRWIIKMILPLGFALIATQSVARCVRLIVELIQPATAAPRETSRHD